jgi:hypothetical protein
VVGLHTKLGKKRYTQRQQTKIQSGRPVGGGGMKFCTSSLDHKKGWIEKWITLLCF